MIPVLRRGQKQNSQATSIPAPIKGINAIAGLVGMAPDECIYTYNLMPYDFGAQVRQGYKEWANGWTGGAAKTVISFEGNTAADDRLFVASPEGIFDCTTEGETTPTQVVTFPSSADEAGVCTSTLFTNDGEERFLLVTDAENGYYIYSADTDVWTKVTSGGGPGSIQGVDPADLVYVMIWKNRLWFIEKNTTNAWYLSAGAITGQATQFNFGTQFRQGGQLLMMLNWTLDGGDGIDDLLVAISKSGDVVVYKGTDPAQASTFGLVGVWYVGDIPHSNRVAYAYAGEIYILSVYGLLPMSALLNGSSINDPEVYITHKISRYVRIVMDTSFNNSGWQVYTQDKKGFLSVTTPINPPANQVSFSMYLGTNGWGIQRGLPRGHSTNWQGETYFCDNTTNKLFIDAGDVDGVFIDPDTDGQPQSIDWSALSSFQTLGEPARYKRCQYIRPMFVAGGTPSFKVKAAYDFDIAEIAAFPVIGGNPSALWDASNWNSALWGGGINSSDNPRGANGLGRHIAINIRGRSSEPTVLISYDITYDFGGLM